MRSLVATKVLFVTDQGKDVDSGCIRVASLISFQG